MVIRKPAEWEGQRAVMIAWPHIQTDWGPFMDQVVPVYREMARLISARQPLWILCRDELEAKRDLKMADMNQVRFVEIPFNDTWVRDYGPLIVYEDGDPVLLDYRFNGWGGKFNAELDNRVTSVLYGHGFFDEQVSYRDRLDFVLEGGAVETDGRGLMIATTRSILSPGRNAVCGLETATVRLENDLGLRKVDWLHNGRLEGDDTDGHIDMLARFCDAHTLCYVRCDDKRDPHYSGLKKMEEELKGLKNVEDEPFRLLPLPLPDPVYSAKGIRLPASYANFLIMNEAVLMPVYGCRADEAAREVLSEAFRGREILTVNARPLIMQGGSVHCATLQFPEGVL